MSMEKIVSMVDIFQEPRTKQQEPEKPQEKRMEDRIDSSCFFFVLFPFILFGSLVSGSSSCIPVGLWYHLSTSMTKSCPICKRGSILGGGYSNRTRATKFNPTGTRRRHVNLQWARTGSGKRVKVCTSCMKVNKQLAL